VQEFHPTYQHFILVLAESFQQIRSLLGFGSEQKVKVLLELPLLGVGSETISDLHGEHGVICHRSKESALLGVLGD
jgi:hypothetical protein